jgi:bla regulator protein BlaR1
MENILTNISQVLGISLLHSLWQGLIIYGVLRLILIIRPDLPSTVKYRLAYTGMLLILAWFAYTFYNEADNYSWFKNAGNRLSPLTLTPLTKINQSYRLTGNGYLLSLKPYLPYISLIYMAGVAFNVFKLSFAWKKTRQIKQTLLPAGAMQGFSDKLCVRLDIRKNIGVFYSELIDVPCIIGLIKPIILLPLSLPVNLSVAEAQAILLHELAHIKRNDYLANLIQQVISVILFFNPFAKLINRIINTERENCCDDTVLSNSGQPLTYAQALLKLEECRQQNWRLALAATGKKYNLLTRIERIMKNQTPTPNFRQLLVLLLLFAGGISSVAWLNPKIDNAQLTVKLKPFIIDKPLADTIKPVAKRNLTLSGAKAANNTAKATITNNGVRLGDDFNDPELKRLAAEVEKHGNAISKVYDSPEFKKNMAALEEQAKQIEAYYNNPEMKSLIAEQQKQAELIGKQWDNNPEFKKLTAQMEQLGKDIEKNYNTAEYKNLQQQMEKQGKLLSLQAINSPEYKKQLSALTRLSGEYAKQISSPMMKEQMEKLTQLSAQLSKEYLNNPEYLKQQDKLKALSDSIGKAYQSQQLQIQTQKMADLGKATNIYSTHPELLKEQQLLKEASEKLQKYQNSPEFKRKLEEYKKTHPESTTNN